MRKVIVLVFIVVLSFSSFAQVGFIQEGFASYYADKFEGHVTASGEKYSHKKATCAHMSIPFGALVKITNLENNQTAIVRVNDRGPFVPDRIIDVSQSVAQRLGMLGKGATRVKIEVVDNNGHGIAVNSVTEKQQINSPADTIVSKSAVNIQEKQDGNVKANVSKVPVQDNKSSVDDTKQVDNEIFLLKVESKPAKGFAIQVGSYKELVNVLRIASDLENSLKKEVLVQVTNINGDKIYRLMIGSFSSRKEAEQFKEKVSKIYSDCFIVEVK